jgi:hypothetical protein
VLAPFAGLINPAGEVSLGLFVGTGDQDNYVRLVLAGGAEEVRLLTEVGGTVGPAQAHPLDLPGPDYVELFLDVDPSASPPTITARYQAITSGTPTPVVTLGSVQVPPEWLASPVAAGLISTSRGGAPFAASWDFLRIDLAAP